MREGEKIETNYINNELSSGRICDRYRKAIAFPFRSTVS